MTAAAFTRAVGHSCEVIPVTGTDAWRTISDQVTTAVDEKEPSVAFFRVPDPPDDSLGSKMPFTEMVEELHRRGVTTVVTASRTCDWSSLRLEPAMARGGGSCYL